MRKAVVSLLVVSATAACGGAPPEGGGRGAQPPAAIHLPLDGDLVDRGTAGIEMHVEGDEVRFDDGVVGQAVFIGGTDDWIEGAVPEGLDLSDGGTLELWVKRDDWVNPHREGSGVQTFATIDALILDISVRDARDPNRNRLRGAARSVGFAIHRAMAEASLPPLTWTHVAIVYDGEARTATLYVDGEAVAERTDVPALVTEYPNPFKIGTWHRANQAFRGWIDEVRVFDYSRPPERVAEAPSGH